MREIRINGQVIDLPPTAGTSFEKVSPYFTYEDIFTSEVSIPSIPLSQHNRRIFGYLDLPRLGSDLPRYFLQKFYNGQLIHESLALVSDVTPDAIQLKAIEPIGEFFGDYQKKKFSEIDLGTVARPAQITPVLLVDGQPGYCFPTVLNPDYYGTNGGSVNYSGRMNHYVSGSYQSGPMVPMPFLSFVLNRIAQLTGTTLKGTFFTHPVWSQLVLYNTRALDSQTQITLSRHLPQEMTLIQLFIELRKLLNLSFTFDTVNRVLEIDATDDILNTPATLDWSDKLVKGSRKIIERNRRLQLSMNLDSGDQLQKDKPEQLADYLTPEFAPDLGIAKITTAFSTLLIDQQSGLASTKQVGSTELFSQLASTWSPRLLLWNGLQGGLPRALPTLAEKSLFWSGLGGLVQSSWKRTEQLRKGLSYLDAQMILDETDIGLLKFRQPVHVQGMNYRVVRISGSLPLTSSVQVLLLQDV